MQACGSDIRTAIGTPMRSLSDESVWKNNKK
jgi:hypothetical protein